MRRAPTDLSLPGPSSSSTPPPRVTRRAAIDANKLALARRFRRHPTAAEAAAWQLLRGRKILGLKFRRQQLIAGFVVDFYCPALRLILELDGAVHDNPVQAEYDALRTQILSTLAIDLVRIPNAQVTEAFLRETLLPYVQRCPLAKPPSPFRERGVGG
jgi:very-short-patch-repair endonuclease